MDGSTTSATPQPAQGTTRFNKHISSQSDVTVCVTSFIMFHTLLMLYSSACPILLTLKSGGSITS